MQPITRRQFLVSAGSSALTLVLASCASPLVASAPSAASTAGANPHGPAGSPVPLAPAPNLTPAPAQIIITKQTDLYQQNYADTPQVDMQKWNLTIDGLVDSPLKVDLDTLKALPKYDDVRTLECIGNPIGGHLIGNAEWNGIHLKDLLAKTKIDPAATHVNFEAADGYFTSVKLDWLMQDGTMLVHGLNGDPLTPEHGFPLRINMPGLYGQKMPKWITHLQFTDKPVTGYWEAQGWSNSADVQTNSIFDFPGDGQNLPSAIVPVYGVAFAGKKKIVKVEVSFDGQTWQAAKLLPNNTPLIWTQWSLDWPAQLGTYRLSVRATDDTGFTQNAGSGGYLSESYPNGPSAIHTIAARIG